MSGGHTPVGTRHVRVCEVEDSDETPVEKISWCQVVRVPNRLFWTEDQFVVTSSPGIRDHKTKVVEIVATSWTQLVAEV